MVWILIAIIGYLLNAIVLIVDKFFITTKVKNPWVYAFYAGILGGLAFLLWPLDFAFLPFYTFLFAIFSGAAFFFGIFFLYSAMHTGEASRVVSIIGGISPIIIFALSYGVLGERLSTFWISAFVFLISGAFLLSLEDDGGSFKFKIGERFPIYSFIAAIFFAVSFFLSKVVYTQASFLNSFIWMRVGSFSIAVFLLLWPSLRKAITRNPLNVSPGLPFFFISNKALSAFAFLILNYAISLGSVTVVNALQGVQYAFIFVLALATSLYNPKFLEESFSIKAITQKIVGIALVSIGVALLFLF
jgi:uncharacterized membrane protein